MITTLIADDDNDGELQHDHSITWDEAIVRIIVELDAGVWPSE